MKKILIIGLGLIGSSIALGIKRANPDFEILGSDRENIQEIAQKRGIIDSKVSLVEGAQKADIIILAVPIITTLELLKKLTKEKGTSVIMITHDLGVVASMCDRIAIMYAGQIVEEGTVDEIFYEPHHPYTKGLLNSINNSAKDNDEPLAPIPGTPPDLLKLPKGCAFMSRCPYTMKICEVQASPVTTYSETHCCRCWLECMDETKITVSGEEAALEDSMAGSHFYPDFAAVLLKQKVAEQYGLKAENVLTGAGSSAMIDMIGLTFLDDGDEVLFSAPTYGHLPTWRI